MRYSHKPGLAHETDLPALSTDECAQALKAFESSVARLKAAMSHQLEEMDSKRTERVALRQELEKLRLKLLASETGMQELRQENLSLKRSLSEERKNGVRQSESYEKSIASLNRELNIARLLLTNALGGEADEPRHSLVVQKKKTPAQDLRTAETVRPRARK